MSSKPLKCNKGCGTTIHFDDMHLSKSGKKIPLEEDGEPHQCPNALPYTGTGQGPSAKVSNPIERIVEHENHRDQKIKEAQEQRKAEHDELIAAMKTLTVEIAALTNAIQKKEWQVNSNE